MLCSDVGTFCAIVGQCSLTAAHIAPRAAGFARRRDVIHGMSCERMRLPNT